tara:strand:- start:74 stop:727 length:654 start_codon:yes stop_codon:yes gene_type:complete
MKKFNYTKRATDSKNNKPLFENKGMCEACGMQHEGACGIKEEDETSEQKKPKEKKAEKKVDKKEDKPSTKKPKDDIKDSGSGAKCTQQDFNDMSYANDLPGLFVNGNPTNFINNMWNKYEAKGCPQDGGFFLKILEKHDNQLQLGMGGPNSNKPMGPKWKDQKQSKIDFLQDVINDCCPADAGGGSGPTDPNAANNGGPIVPESLQERFKKLANIIK